MNVYTLNNTALALKEPMLNRGGEGAVYDIIGHPDKVAKIYHSAADARKREPKIREMALISESNAFKSANIGKDIAWPLAPLFDSNRQFVGFVMEKINSTTELDQLYVYPPQKTTMPIRERINCLISICGVIGKLHSIDQVFGDFNPNNIKIRSDGTACFVDADSYHIKSSGKLYKCIVCCPGYVAPEIIRKCKGTTYEAYKGSVFTKESDNFALAIHIFRMLMHGAHPYTCKRHTRGIGSAPAPKPIDRHVETGDTPFFRKVPNFVPPDYAPDVSALPPYIRDLFRRAFVEGHSNPSARPDPSEWSSALRRYLGELSTCSNKAHHYWNGAASCPYCEADKRFRKILQVNTQPCKPSLPPAAANTPATVTYQPPRQVAAAVAPQPSSVSHNVNIACFWFLTLAVSVVLQLLLGNHVFPRVYSVVYTEAILLKIAVTGSIISGVAGSVIYNIFWAKHRYIGNYKWYEYVLSVLCSLGFSVAFGIVMFLAIAAFIVIMYILAGALVIAFLAALGSGG